MHAGVAIAPTAVIALACGLAPASAQPLTIDRVRSAVDAVPDLDFPAQPSKLSVFSNPGMAIYKPEGAGPFPAVVLVHQCGGLAPPGGRYRNVSMLDWARVATAHGYVAFLVDSLAPRGIDSVCMGAKQGVTVSRGVRDAFQALEHLRKLDYVDPERIVMAGFSWGAMVGLGASGKANGEGLGDGRRFKAVVSFYPGCWTGRTPTGASFEFVPPDIDRPLLVLMGDQDTETPPAECLQRMEPQKASGAPVEWHVYPGATHCFDCAHLDRYRKVDARGHDVVYRYDKAATQDAEQRMFGFFDAALRKAN
jgi:dienelactone hydrolase